MGAIEIIVIVAAIGFVAGVIITAIIRKKKNKGGCCGCDCAHCAGHCNDKDIRTPNR